MGQELDSAFILAFIDNINLFNLTCTSLILILAGEGLGEQPAFTNKCSFLTVSLAIK